MPENRFEVITIETKALGDRSYVVTDGRAAAAIDPQRDIDRVEAVLDERDLRLTHVFETHIHNDYVTGGVELARRAAAAYVVPADDRPSYDHVGARQGDRFDVGTVTITAVHTPGHTPHHLSYVAAAGRNRAAVFTGGSMLYGTVGRTDLIDRSSTDELTRQQYRSVRRLATELPGSTTVHPTHGFGSFCSSTSSSGRDESNVATERATNVACVTEEEDEFVTELLGGLTAYPRYYAHMAPINLRGPAPIDLSPPEPVDRDQIRERIEAGEWVVDLRSRTEFARGHVTGTINVELGDHFATYLGWTRRWATPVTLMGDGPEEVAGAQREMVRIGIDRPAGAADGGFDSWAKWGEIGSYRSASFEELASARAAQGMVVLDVRRDDEWAEGHIEGAIHIPLHELEERLSEVPDGEIWVHCASGYRAAIAASLLDRAGHRVVTVDDDWEVAARHRELPIGLGGPPERAG